VKIDWSKVRCSVCNGEFKPSSIQVTDERTGKTSSRKVMGQCTNSPLLKSLGWITFAIMTAAAVGMLIT